VSPVPPFTPPPRARPRLVIYYAHAYGDEDEDVVRACAEIKAHVQARRPGHAVVVHAGRGVFRRRFNSLRQDWHAMARYVGRGRSSRQRATFDLIVVSALDVGSFTRNAVRWALKAGRPVALWVPPGAAGGPALRRVVRVENRQDRGELFLASPRRARA
jgi:hypothetical protein